MSDVPIRHAATVILVRDAEGDPAVLMGQRGAKAAFMAQKFVFPGGAVDPGDAAAPLDGRLSEPCRTRLGEEARGAKPEALVAAAIRELWEETGLILGTPGNWPDPPADWAGFSAAGFRPDA
ncbi:MAG: DNA mismatch repair protein MutT, partial [Pseudomonadota bacterium]